MIRIRRLRRADAPAVRRLVENVLREHGLWRSHAGFTCDLDDIARAYRSPGAFLVAVEGARVVGCGGLESRGPGRASLQRMYLLKKLRGQGLGRRILLRLLSRARRAGLRELTLETAPRLKAAIALYRAHGFRRTRARALKGDCCTIKLRLILKPNRS